jgi:hypothetical protein
MNEEIVVKSTQEAIEDFKQLFEEGMLYLEEAAKVYVRAIDADPEAASEFHRCVPYVPKQAWKSFEAVGRGALDHRLLVMEANRAKQLGQLPLSDQKKLLDGGMELLVDDGDKLIIKVHEATADQIKQVIGPAGIRTLSEQKALQAAQRRSSQRLPKIRPRKQASDKYKVGDGGIYVRDAAFLTEDELFQALMEVRTS